MIHVPDVKATMEWYQSIGFELLAAYGDDDEDGEVGFAVLRHGAGWVYFDGEGKSSDADRREVDLYVHVENVQEAYDRLKERVAILHDLNDTFYGTREFIIRDLNGFWVTFGQDLK